MRRLTFYRDSGASTAGRKLMDVATEYRGQRIGPFFSGKLSV
jgi:hypothetical protein